MHKFMQKLASAYKLGEIPFLIFSVYDLQQYAHVCI